MPESTPSEDLSSRLPTAQGAVWRDLTTAVSTVSRLAAAAEKAVRAADVEGDPKAALAALGAVERLLLAAQEPDLSPVTLGSLAGQLAESVEGWRLSRLSALRDAAASAGLPFQRLATDELRIGELSVRLDLEAGTAEVSYAREPLETVRAEPKAVVEAVRRHAAALRNETPPETVFRELAQAYLILRAQRGLPAGERVNLVDLLPPLFFVRQTESFWRKQEPKALRPVSRAQLAWDLDALQRARCLELDGLRIALGTATGGSTAKKSSVLYLESAAAGGQYFLTFAMRRIEAIT